VNMDVKDDVDYITRTGFPFFGSWKSTLPITREWLES